MTSLNVMKVELLITRKCEFNCKYCKIVDSSSLKDEEMTTDEVVEALIIVLEYPDEEVVELAQGALRINGSSGLKSVIEGVNKGSDTTKQYLIEISSFLKSPELLEIILSQAESENPDIRTAVAKTLAKYHDQRTINVLIKLANDDVGHVICGQSLRAGPPHEIAVPTVDSFYDMKIGTGY